MVVGKVSKSKGGPTQCGICSEPLGADARLLPCNDGFCLECLTQVHETGFNLSLVMDCPTCTKPATLPEGVSGGQTDLLPLVFPTVESILASQKRRKSVEKPPKVLLPILISASVLFFVLLAIVVY